MSKPWYLDKAHVLAVRYEVEKVYNGIENIGNLIKDSRWTNEDQKTLDKCCSYGDPVIVFMNTIKITKRELDGLRKALEDLMQLKYKILLYVDNNMRTTVATMLAYVDNLIEILKIQADGLVDRPI